MQYVSTRGSAPHLGFEDALLAGLARDGGLYVPERWPVFKAEEIAAFAGRPFHEVASVVVNALAGGAIPKPALDRMTADAYATFGHEAVTPLVQIGSNRFVLELFHGPTLAFKDVAMQLLARLMDHVLEKRDARATIVGATSGDTGGAAIEAFRASKRTDVFILFPDGRVSDVQRRMMTTPTEPHIHAIAIDGTFDDAQARVKDMFNHHAFRDRVQLSGVNSINWARIAAQVTYYFVAAVALGAPHRKVSFSVPTGNFGDIFAGYVARCMGLPVERLVIATNSNDILARTVASGRYETRGVVATSSPSMDIQVSSNFERYLFEASGRDAGLIGRLMDGLKQSGAFELPGAMREALKRDFAAGGASEAEVASAIRTTLAASGYLLDPHTACAVVALDKQGQRGAAPEVVLATAHPAKFPDTMAAITGQRPGLPPRLASLMTDAERIERLPNDTKRLEGHIERHARAVTEARR
ncbi:MAG TPA: threonine synthase [Hyphomicrobiaceae bacterium]|nr:threonine synthase [Hyphomicrobiaceae bacterium]